MSVAGTPGDVYANGPGRENNCNPYQETSRKF